MKDRNVLALRTNAPARRQAIVGSAVAFGGLALGLTKAWADTEEEVSHTAESVHQEAVFKASRKRVYEALTRADQFDKVVQRGAAMQSGTAPTEIGRLAGEPFSLFDGHIVGRHIELVPNERIASSGHFAVAGSIPLFAIATAPAGEARKAMSALPPPVPWPR